MFHVVPKDAPHGFFNFDLSTSHLMAVCERAEVFIVAGENPPLAQLPVGQGAAVNIKVAKYIMEHIRGGIQLGICGMPNELGKMIADSG